MLKFTDSCNAVGLGSFHLKITLINLAICKLFLIHFKRLLPRNSSSYISGQKKCHLKFKKGLKCFYVYKPSKFFLCPSCCFQKCKGIYIRLARIIHAGSLFLTIALPCLTLIPTKVIQVHSIFLTI